MAASKFEMSSQTIFYILEGFVYVLESILLKFLVMFVLTVSGEFYFFSHLLELDCFKIPDLSIVDKAVSVPFCCCGI